MTGKMAAPKTDRVPQPPDQCVKTEKESDWAILAQRAAKTP